ncbi:MAG TPA: SUF system NifU family Fe-S cluster assembly protein [Rudaea sp.]
MGHGLYTQAVIDHHRAPRHFGSLDAPTHTADGANPLCGDALRFELAITGDTIDALRFRGEACAIAIATASMLSELALGQTAAQIERIENEFVRAISGEPARAEILGGLGAMSALAAHPVRRKCALLPFATLRAAMRGQLAATTEDRKP